MTKKHAAGSEIMVNIYACMIDTRGRHLSFSSSFGMLLYYFRGKNFRGGNG